MCGRFTLTASAQQLQDVFGLEDIPEDLRPRYNIAPTQDAPVVRILVQEEGRRLHLLRWGLVPSWAKDEAIGNRMINARAETVHHKPAYRAAYKRRRCLVLCSGFYEWQRRGKAKQPHLIRMRDGRPFAMAGLWERWTGPTGEVLESCTIITTEANELVSAIHQRMPVILHPEDFDSWLDPTRDRPQALADLLRPYPAEEMESFPVSKKVNNPRIDDPTCIEPDDPDPQLF
jgi:putative SOS response-associated peptidase YedK